MKKFTFSLVTAITIFSCSNYQDKIIVVPIDDLVLIDTMKSNDSSFTIQRTEHFFIKGKVSNIDSVKTQIDRFAISYGDSLSKNYPVFSLYFYKETSNHTIKILEKETRESKIDLMAEDIPLIVYDWSGGVFVGHSIKYKFYPAK